jgi:hypothetical protein
MIARRHWIFVLVALVAAGCTTTVIPPKNVTDPVNVYLTDYGRHSSILLRDPESHQLKEFAFGDWNWFAINQNTSGDAVEALFFSPGSTLGRRQLDASDDIGDVHKKTEALTVQSFCASREKVNRLLAHLDGAFNSHLDTITYNALMQFWFVRTPDAYSVWHNCNRMTTRWLNYLGCQTKGLGAFSKFKVQADAPDPATRQD